jgi:hypothetical protein
MWTSPAIPVPVDVGDREDEEAEIEKLPWAKAELSELWWNVVYGFTVMRAITPRHRIDHKAIAMNGIAGTGALGQLRFSGQSVNTHRIKKLQCR